MKINLFNSFIIGTSIPAVIFPLLYFSHPKLAKKEKDPHLDFEKISVLFPLVSGLLNVALVYFFRDSPGILFFLYGTVFFSFFTTEVLTVPEKERTWKRDLEPYAYAAIWSFVLMNLRKFSLVS